MKLMSETRALVVLRLSSPRRMVEDISSRNKVTTKYSIEPESNIIVTTVLMRLIEIGSNISIVYDDISKSFDFRI